MFFVRLFTLVIIVYMEKTDYALIQIIQEHGTPEYKAELAVKEFRWVMRMAAR